MKKLKVVGALVASALCAVGTQASQVARENGILPVVVSNGTQKLVSVPFVRPIHTAGLVDSVGASNIVVQEALVASAFNDAAGDNRWELEITSGRYIGLSFAILSNSASAVYVNGPVPANILQDSQYVIRRGWTLGSLFGTNEATVTANGIVPGSSAANAGTKIRLFNPATKQIGSEYFFRTNASAALTRWQTGATAANDARLGVDNAFIMQQLVQTKTALFKGEMRKTRTLFGGAGGNGLAGSQAFVGNPSPFALKLGPFDSVSDSGMFNSQGESSQENSVAGGTSAANADKVRLLNPATVTTSDYFFRTNLAIAQWRIGAATATNVTVAAGDGMIVERLNAAGTFRLAVNPAFNK